MTLTKEIPDNTPNKVSRLLRLYRLFRLKPIYLRIRLNLLALKVYRKGLVKVKNTLGDQRFFLALVAIFRGEDKYLKEWIEFHLMMGVEHFFLYDNGLEECSKQILQPYIDRGQVTHIPWPDLPGLRDNNWLGPQTLSIQQLAYGNCVRNFRKNCKWLIQLDLDEFIFPTSEDYDRVDQVLQSLNEDKVLGIYIHSLTFGSSGHVERPEGLVLENYTWSGRTLDGYAKSIANARFLTNDFYMGPHWFRFRLLKEIQQALVGYPNLISGPAANALFRINHYEIKSQEEYLAKKKVNAKGYMAGKENLDRFHQLDEANNILENFEIQRFLPELKQRYGNASQ